MKFCFKLVKNATETSEMSEVGFGGGDDGKWCDGC